MARSCGIRIGPRRVELVVLDGSPRKHKILAVMSDEYALDGDDPAEAMVGLTELLREAVKTHRIPKENVGMVIDTGLAAFRTMRLPFKEKAKIEQVLKFEVENQLPQWNIDDVVVDFFVLEEGEADSQLLTSAVRKADIDRLLHSCTRAGFDPLEVELETSAMVNAAAQAGHFEETSAQVLVHVGEHTTSLVVMDGGKVREMRAIHIGALTHEIPQPAKGDGEEGEEPAEVEAPDPLEVQRRMDQAVKRIRREIGRSVSGAQTQNEVESIFICGIELPGLIGEPILDVPVYELDVFEEDSGSPAEGIGPLVVPYGAALKRLGGGVISGSLRREELRYSGTFEKLELPLAVVCLLVVTLLGVHTIFIFKQHQAVNNTLAYWRDCSNLAMLGDPRKGASGRLEFPPEDVTNYVAEMQRTKKPDGSEKVNDSSDGLDRYSQLTKIKGLIDRDIKKLEKQLGTGTDVANEQPQSAFKAATLVLGVIQQAGDQLGRPSLRMIRSDYQPGKQGQPDTCRVVLDITFFAENTVKASKNHDTFIRLLKSQPWYVEHDLKRTEDIEGGEGLKVQGLPIVVDVSKATEV